MLRILWKGWLVIAKKIGGFQASCILILGYFVLLAPFALTVRLFSDPLGLRGIPSWHRLPRDGKSPAELNAVRQQF